MNFFQQKLSGLKKRLRFFKYGIFYLRDRNFSVPSKLSINGVARNFNFTEPDRRGFIYEFEEICINDCYQLKNIQKRITNIETIVDIGANQGLFIIAARQNFAKSVISAYEPNIQLEVVLSSNADAVGAKVFYEAVTKEDCKVQLNFGESDLHTTTTASQTGTVTGTAFRKVIERAGGKIDILKLDCEGAEWDLLADASSWSNIRSVTMEYHLWAKNESSVELVVSTLKELGFQIISNSQLSGQFGLVTAVKK